MDTLTVCKTRKTSILIQMRSSTSRSNSVTHDHHAITTASSRTNVEAHAPLGPTMNIHADGRLIHPVKSTVTNKDTLQINTYTSTNIKHNQGEEYDDEDDISTSSHYKFFMDDVEDADGPKSSDDDDDEVVVEDEALETILANKKNHNHRRDAIGIMTSSNPKPRMIVADDNDKSMYIFRKIQDRDRVVFLVQLLISRLHQNNQENQSFSESTTTTTTTIHHDPSLYHSSTTLMTREREKTDGSSYYKPLQDLDSSKQGTSVVISSTMSNTTRPRITNTTTRQIHRRKLSRSRSVTPFRHYPIYKSTSSTILDDTQSATTLSPVSSRHRVWSEWVLPQGEENDSIMEADASLFLSKNMLSAQVTTDDFHNNLDTEHGRLWMEKKKLFDGLENEALSTLSIPCSLHDFFTWFLSDSAIYPMHEFLTQVIKDTNIRTSSWSNNRLPSPSQHCFEKTRRLTLDHRLTSSFGPSHAATTRTQTCTYIQDKGLCVQEKTEISGAPAADCFYVETIWLLEHKISSSLNETQSHPSILIHVRFQVHFVKGTMFKSIISSMTRSETENWFKSYIKIVKSICQERQGKRQGNRYSINTLSLDSYSRNERHSPSSTMSQNQIDDETVHRKTVGKDSLCLLIIISLLGILLFSCLYFISSIYMNLRRLEKEILEIRKVCQ